MNTTTLTGSEKQITWATTIRDQYTARIDAVDVTCRAAQNSPVEVAGLDTLRELFAGITDARVLIDNRRDLSMALIRIPAYAAMSQADRKPVQAAASIVTYGW